MLRPYPVPLLVLALLFAAATAAAAEVEGGDVIGGIPVPPSPGDPEAHPGDRIWDPPRFTHYPLVVYEGEERNLAFHVPIPPDRARDRTAGLDRSDGAYHNPFGWLGGDRGSIAWRGGETLPVELPVDPELERVSGLLDLPARPGRHVAELQLGEGRAELSLRMVSVRGVWPHHRLVDGFPVDRDGVPVVLYDRRRDPDAERQWAALRSALPRPEGRPIVVGDPLAAPDGDSWAGLEELADLRPIDADRYPHHGLALALARLPDPLPRTIVWSPGNSPIHARVWSSEEERILGALRHRLEHLGAMPRLVLVLPPLPSEAHLVAEAEERRALLKRSAQFLGWEVIDAARIAGDPKRANRAAEGIYARHPMGVPRERLRDAVRSALER